MAKSVLKKKKRVSRRLKKSVRRTLGALCMITAIIVAAIPFPDAAANPEDTEGTEETTPGVTIPLYADNVNEDDFLNITDSTGKFDLRKEYKSDAASQANIQMAQIVSDSGSAWELDWQYKYYSQSDGDVCLITEYNSLYPQETISLNTNVFANYVNIPQEQYVKLIGGETETTDVDVYAGDEVLFTKSDVRTLGWEYVLSGNPTVEKSEDNPDGCKGCDACLFFEKNFPDRYKAYSDAYKDYLQNIKDAAIPDEEGNTSSEIFYPPNAERATYGDTVDNKLQYVCNEIFGTGTDPMTLEIVYKQVYEPVYDEDGVTIIGQQVAKQPEEVRIPRLVNPPANGRTYVEDGNGNAYRVDQNLFLAKNYARLVGVAKGAFTGVRNVWTLEMSKDVYIIADSAFEGSFLREVTLSRDARIGNRAFKNCPNLTSVVMPDGGITQIGAEAFAQTSITSMSIPSTVEEIGAGAFSYCKNLRNVEFTGNNATSNRKVGEFAFYNCLGLENVNFNEAGVSNIGQCAFAIDEAPTANMAVFNFPNYIKSGGDIGDFMLAGRTNLAEVTMPRNLGSGTLPDHLFHGCVGLDWVAFPEEAQGVSYNPGLFNDVMKDEFYVRGPKTTNAGEISAPRRSTWSAYFLNTKDKEEKRYVPYVYKENGEDFFEVNLGSYVCVIDKDGLLVSCEYAPSSTGELDTKFAIPASVGERTVTGIKDGALGDVKDPNSVVTNMTELSVADGCEITTIEDNVFSGAPELEKVYLGDSIQSIGANSFSNCPELKAVEIGSGITSIGNSAFENCPNLTEMSFANPKDGAESFPLSAIGTNAFSTGGNELTIFGCIDGTYGPFAWAMQPDNYMDKSKGVRVCYKSAKEDPQGMTVILDNSNNLPTLVDYPKYSEIPDTIIDKLNGGGTMTPEDAAIVNAAVNIVVPNGVESIDAKGYFSSSSKVFGEEPVYKFNEASIAAYFSDPSDNVIGGIYDENGELVESQSMYSIKDENENGLFNSTHTSLTTEYGEEDPERPYYEKIQAGNDRIQSVTLNSVKYLPEYCFDSCERLQTANIGPVVEEMDALPFRGCTSLSSVASGNDKYECTNGILYENAPDGSKKILECLASRGDVVGSPTVSVESDPLLSSVSEILPAAFSECPNITRVFLQGADMIDEIPDSCFEGSDILKLVDLPENIQLIGERAFADTGSGIEVYVRGHEVSLGKEAFDGTAQPYLISYEDSGVRKAAGKQGVNIDQIIPEGNTVQVYFRVLHNGVMELISVIDVVIGESAKRLAPWEEDMKEFIPDGYHLAGWTGESGATLDNITESCTFYAQIVQDDTSGDKPDDGTGDKPDDGTGDKPDDGTGDKPDDGTGDKPDDGTGNKPDDDNNGNVSDNNSGGNNSGGSNSGNTSAPKKYSLSVVYGNGSGIYASGTNVIISAIEPPAGKEFYKWTTNNTGVTITSATSAATTVKTTNSDAVVTATYRDKSSVSSNSVNRRPIGNSGSTVQITKPGISNTDKAYASVSGSTDNFIIKITESNEAANAVATALSNKYMDMNPIKYFAMDISLYDKNGNKVTNTNGLSVNVTMPIPDALVQYGGNNKVGAVVNGNVLEDLSCKFTTVDGIPCVTFTARHFSPYTIYVDTSNLSVNTLDSTPKTGDGIHPKWFVSIALACISLILFMKRDKVVAPRKITV